MGVLAEAYIEACREAREKHDDGEMSDHCRSAKRCKVAGTQVSVMCMLTRYGFDVYTKVSKSGDEAVEFLLECEHELESIFSGRDPVFKPGRWGMAPALTGTGSHILLKTTEAVSKWTVAPWVCA